MSTKEEAKKVLPFVGRYKWNVVTEALEPRPRGVLLANLHPDMLTEEGYVVLREEEQHTRTYEVVYDRDYISEFLHTKLYRQLNIVRPNGDFNLPLRQEIIERADEYSQDTHKRSQEEDLNRRASGLAQQNGIPFEEAKELLMENDRALQAAIAARAKQQLAK